MCKYNLCVNVIWESINMCLCTYICTGAVNVAMTYGNTERYFKCKACDTVQ